MMFCNTNDLKAGQSAIDAGYNVQLKQQKAETEPV